MVLCAGGVLMGLEISASRVLAPYFGNSIFVWGSLISVFLIALSLGYYFGGRVADKRPSHVLLNYILLAVSLWILGIAALSSNCCELLVKTGLDEKYGPLVASLILYLPPGVGMGMVSPFAIRLATRCVSSVGTISGTLYALSTIGGIAGTLLTTFVFIPLIGLSAILGGLALVLSTASVFNLVLWKRREDYVLSFGLILLIVVYLCLPASPRIVFGRHYQAVVDVDTAYHHISVIDNTLDDTREMRFDPYYVESSIRKCPPYPSSSSYTNYFHLAFLALPDIERSLFIGAGGGIGPRAFQMHNSGMDIDLVDIDPKVLELSRTHFFLEDTRRVRTIAKDGRMFVRDTGHKYDCIVVDAFSAGARIPSHLATREFLQLCDQKMTEDGVFVMNIISAVDGPLAGIFHSMYRTVESVFPNTYVFAADHQARGRDQSMNIILLATKTEERIPREEWTARAEGYRSESYVENETIERAVRDLLVDVPDTSAAPLFTDDYSPIDTMPFRAPGRSRDLLLRASKS